MAARLIQRMWKRHKRRQAAAAKGASQPFAQAQAVHGGPCLPVVQPTITKVDTC